MAEKKKSWEHRLSGKIDERAMDFVESLSFDKRLYKYDIAGSIAHGQMLAEQKLISKEEFMIIKEGLLAIESQIEAGKFKFDVSQEDIHMAIEAALIAKTGEAGKKLHTGRSRNDQVATDMKLWTRDAIEIVQEKIAGLQKAFVSLAKEYGQDIMPVYTHMQRAQPVVIGAYLLSFVETLERDVLRFGNCGDLLDVNPLGSGAIAGTTLPIDRDITTRLLGFRGKGRNSIDSVTDRDFCAEFIFCCSLLSVHLSRLAEDWIIFSSSEFGFVRISDSFCTSSSMMPQKRNPDMLELIRGKTGRVFGSLIGMLTVLKGLASGYNRDLQEDKVHLFSAADCINQCLDVAEGIVSNTAFNTEIIKKDIDEGFSDATCLAEYLVVKGVPFRKAHGIVGSIVASCEKQGKKLAELELSELTKHCDRIDKDVKQYLGADNVVKRYASEGSGGVKQVKKQIEHWEKIFEEK